MRLLVTGANYRRHRSAGLAGSNAQVTEQGQRPEPRLLEVGTVGAPAEVAMRLGLDENAPVIVLRRLFLVDDQPVALCDSYYPAAMAEGTVIAEPRRIRGGALAVIEDPAGPIRRMAARSVDELTSRMPTRPEVDQLQLSPGVPVVRVLRTIYDNEGAPLEVQEDDGSDPARVEPCLRAVASRCDLLLGPYSTQLMRAVSRVSSGRAQMHQRRGQVQPGSRTRQARVSAGVCAAGHVTPYPCVSYRGHVLVRGGP